MKVMEIVSQWTHAVKELLPKLHGHQAKALAAISYAMDASGHVDCGRVSLHLPPAKPASVARRMERLWANRQLRVADASGQLSRSLLSSRPPGSKLLLILDETPGAMGLRCMKISFAYRHRAVPLVWECYRPDHPPEPMPRLLWHLMHRVSRCLPPGVQVTFLADRGLSWPVVLDGCVLLGWHYVLRMQGQTKLRLGEGREVHARDLVKRPGAKGWAGAAQIYKKAGWRKAHVTAVWDKRCKEPWLLASDLPAGWGRCSSYCKRSWCEQLHRDEKSQGLNWQRSHVREPSHARRLVLAMALAVLLAIGLGTRVIKSGLRRLLESRRVRKLSVFQMGLRYLQLMLQGQAPALPVRPYLVPP